MSDAVRDGAVLLGGGPISLDDVCRVAKGAKAEVAAPAWDRVARAAAFVDEAVQALSILPDAEGRDALAVLAGYLVERTS